MTAKTPLLDELAERGQHVVEAHVKIREVEDQARHAATEATRLREELVEAFATADQAAARKLTKAKGEADAHAAEPWAERAAGAKRAADRQRAELDAWRATHVRQLLAEVAPDATAAADAVNATVTELEAARKGWHAIASTVTGLISGVPGFDPRDIPTIDGADQAIRQLRRDIGDVPPPLPRRTQVAILAPMHDPDPEIRDAARAEIRAAKRQRVEAGSATRSPEAA